MGAYSPGVAALDKFSTLPGKRSAQSLIRIESYERFCPRRYIIWWNHQGFVVGLQQPAQRGYVRGDDGQASCKVLK